MLARKQYLVLILLLSSSVFSEIVVDGILDEADWESAREVSQFYEVYPFSLNPDHKDTKVLIKEDREGIYFAFINKQPKETLRLNQHQRDQGARPPVGDQNGVTIDFDNDGRTGYRFIVNAGGSIIDGVVVNENEMNDDWDGDWLQATSINDEGWVSEILIPWSIAPMKSVSSEEREIGLCFYRLIISEFRVFATCRGSPYQEKFLSIFPKIKVKKYETSQLDIFPYLTFSDDSATEVSNTKGGAELFWKIDSSRQLNATINPDFGQVESDELVVNFSAYETYYSDKRPFFAENQSLFNVQGYETFYVINTRRIGASPDYQCSQFTSNIETLCNQNQAGTSDIDVALRYIQQTENLDFGFLGAMEANEDYSKGRDFYAVRLRKNSDNLTVGYLGTYVDRPVLNREAKVHTSDFEYRPNENLRLNGVLLNSKIDDQNGYGFRAGYLRTPSKSFSGGMGIYYFDEKLDLSDMGYLYRNDLFMFAGRYQWKNSDLPKESSSRDRNYSLTYSLNKDSDWNSEPISVSLTLENGFKNFTDLELKLFFRSSGRDNQITRGFEGASYIDMPKGYGYELQYMNMSGKRFKYMFHLMRRKGEEYSSALGWNKAYDFLVEYTPMDSISYSIFYQDLKEQDWLNWIENNILGTYDMRQRLTVAGINWFKGDKHELRLKAQLVAFTSRNPQTFLADNTGNLLASNIQLPPLTLSDLAFQIRYRYEIKPLSYFYLVYTKGGRVVQFDEEDSLGKIYQRPWEDPQTDTFTVKLRYRF
ncbi:MAG: DUF5916 domain-containing protein [Gammaproteobacteria bacterium]